MAFFGSLLPVVPVVVVIMAVVVMVIMLQCTCVYLELVEAEWVQAPNTYMIYIYILYIYIYIYIYKFSLLSVPTRNTTGFLFYILCPWGRFSFRGGLRQGRGCGPRYSRQQAVCAHRRARDTPPF